MCGIHASISTKSFQRPSHDLKRLLCNRGPDHVGTCQAQIDSEDGPTYFLSFTSTVLALRGDHITLQPFQDLSSGSVLCWNGEAWRIGSQAVVGNDGQAVFDLLIEASSSHKLASESTAAVLRVLQSISGPFTFVYLDKMHGKVYFGRDRLGRRSLLYNSDVSPASMEFASLANPTAGMWEEVEADAIYFVSFSDGDTLKGSKIEKKSLYSASILPVHKHIWETLAPDSSVSTVLSMSKMQFRYLWLLYENLC